MAKKKNTNHKNKGKNPSNKTKQTTEKSKVSNTPPPKIDTPIEKNSPEVVKSALAFDKENYYIMFGGLLFLVIGLWIMTLDKEPFGFGFMGLTLGPIIVFLGFMIQFIAIFYKKK